MVYIPRTSNLELLHFCFRTPPLSNTASIYWQHQFQNIEIPFANHALQICDDIVRANAHWQELEVTDKVPMKSKLTIIDDVFLYLHWKKLYRDHFVELNF